MPYTKKMKISEFVCVGCGKRFFAPWTTRKPQYHNKACRKAVLAKRKAEKRKQEITNALIDAFGIDQVKAHFSRFSV